MRLPSALPSSPEGRGLRGDRATARREVTGTLRGVHQAATHERVVECSATERGDNAPRAVSSARGTHVLILALGDNAMSTVAKAPSDNFGPAPAGPTAPPEFKQVLGHP